MQLPENIHADTLPVVAGGAAPEGEDPLYADAVRHVRESDRATISSVQRKLRIGYNHAARLVEYMEKDGIVTPMKPDGSRAVIRS